MQELISVIVPIYKVEKYLDRCVRSIVDQTYSNLEIILVDDGSPDNCPQMCDEWAKKDSRIKVIHKENGGLSSARNAGLDAMTGDFVGFIDSDDWVEKEWYETLYNDIKKHNADIAVLGVNVFYEENGKTIADNRAVKQYTSDEALKDLLYFESKIGTAAWDKLYKKNLFDSLRFPNGLNSEDRFTNPIAYYNSHIIFNNNLPLYNYRVRKDSICTNNKMNNHSLDEYKVSLLTYNYLKDKNVDKKALEYFCMSCIRNTLYSCIIKNADKSVIKDFTKKLRKYYWKTIFNKDARLSIKIKLTAICINPILYEKLKGNN